MNKVILSGKFIGTYITTSTSYEGLFEYYSSEVKSGNVIYSSKIVGVHIPKDLMNLETFKEFMSKPVIIGGNLILAELDPSVKTSVIVVLDIRLNTNSDKDINQINISGEVTSIVSGTRGINYGVRDDSSLVTTRVYSRDFSNIEVGQVYRISGYLTSYEYTSKKTNKSYNVCGVFESSRELVS